jgi:thiol-disulfide isomerase/thioredoxin
MKAILLACPFISRQLKQLREAHNSLRRRVIIYASKFAMKTLSFVLLASLLVSCSGAVQPSLADLEIGGTVPAATEAGDLPAILPGRSTFHVSDPAGVALASGKVQLVEFFAYWCAVCKAMAPTVHGLENIYAADVNFVYLDRDDPNTLAIQEQLGYVYQPHFFLLDPDGAVLAQWRGYVEGETLQAAIVATLDSQ